MSEQAQDISLRNRFKFGANWSRFLELLNDKRIDQAKKSLQEMLGVESLSGKTFLDIGSGSGLFSLAARLLGATVFSFDYDPLSVACTSELRKRYFPDDSNWTVEEGSVLDKDYMSSLGHFDIVYSWGVLHHTGRMWTALEHAAIPVKEGGQLFIAIYNDQGGASRRWKNLKRLYNKSLILRPFLTAYTMVRQWYLTIIKDSLSGTPLASWKNYKKERGMSAWHDIIDWIGGYPFEVAKPEEIFDFYHSKGFLLKRLKTCAGGIGCNEFVFRQSSSDNLEK